MIRGERGSDKGEIERVRERREQEGRGRGEGEGEGEKGERESVCSLGIEFYWVFRRSVSQ